jgi:hypothetical protein
MGCHTWFTIPVLTGKGEIIKEAQAYLDSDDASWLSEGHRKMYQWAIDTENDDVCCDLASIRAGGRVMGSWLVHQNIESHSVAQYNKENGTDYDRYDPFFLLNPDVIEWYSNEPRITGYPERHIHSYDEMIEFMERGHTDEEGKYHAFRYDPERLERIMAGIKTFFERHPQGIIHFG